MGAEGKGWRARGKGRSNFVSAGSSVNGGRGGLGPSDGLKEQGHGWDVKSVDWHPTKSLLVSGGKDNLVKLWDAKSGRELSSFHGHKNTVLCVKWNDNGNWVLTASKDQIIKLYDIRAMKELESFRGHHKDVTALAWHPFHEEYFVSGSYDGSIFHWLVGHETPQIELPNAHDNAVWDLAWHPIGYILCSGSNDHNTRFWHRNRPGDTSRDKFSGGYNQGFGEQNPAFANRVAGNFPMPEGPTTPGPFAPGLARNEGTIPGVGAPMPLSIPSLDVSSQGEQKQSHPISMPMGAPPLPPGPHPSLLVANQNQTYQQNPQQIPQQQALPQQMPSFPLPPPNLSQLQPPSHMPLLPHTHLPRPPPQIPPLGMPSSIPSSMSGSMAMPTSLQLPMPGPMGMQATGNQMVPPMPQGHFLGMNAMQSGGLPPPVGGFPNGLSNIQGPSSTSGSQLYPSGTFNRPQAGQLPMMPGLNPYQPGNPSGMPQPPLPPGPPPQQTQQWKLKCSPMSHDFHLIRSIWDHEGDCKLDLQLEGSMENIIALFGVEDLYLLPVAVTNKSLAVNRETVVTVVLNSER
ncbi:hypothetical protein Ancab_034281 [Ancistrocladus abbreviatus]